MIFVLMTTQPLTSPLVHVCGVLMREGREEQGRVGRWRRERGIDQGKKEVGRLEGERQERERQRSDREKGGKFTAFTDVYPNNAHQIVTREGAREKRDGGTTRKRKRRGRERQGREGKVGREITICERI